MAEVDAHQVGGIAELRMSRAQEMAGRLESPIPKEERQMTTKEIIEYSHPIIGQYKRVYCREILSRCFTVSLGVVRSLS